LSVPFGSGPLRLVLGKDNLGADCFHRSCLVFNPETQQFASPPLLVDKEGTPSLAPEPPHWTSAKEASLGACDPYSFDEKGTTFLARRYLCKQNGPCQELEGEGIGWMRPGPIVGGPG